MSSARTNIFTLFRKDQDYLGKYHAKSAAILFIVNLGLVAAFTPDWYQMLWFLPAIYMSTNPTNLRMVIGGFLYACVASFLSADFHPTNILWVIPAVLLTFPVSAIMHSPSHYAMKPRWLNRPVGELAGLMQMSGFPDWLILHVYHHQYTDQPGLDPHPPMGKSYLTFVFEMRETTANCYMYHYFKIFGKNDSTAKSLKFFLLTSRLNLMMKATFWYLVLGPQLFSFLFLGSLVFKMFHYAWFNYVTHPMENGKPVITNLNSGLYPFINMIGFGIYYHGDHHSNPTYFDPRNVPKTRAEDQPEKIASGY